MNRTSRSDTSFFAGAGSFVVSICRACHSDLIMALPKEAEKVKCVDCETIDIPIEWKAKNAIAADT